jgi:hypothetical protein
MSLFRRLFDTDAWLNRASRVNACQVVPHYPLALSSERCIAQSFGVGRVKFILTDLRSDRDAVTNRDDAAKTTMGPCQKERFKSQLLEANGRYPLICWVSTVPWIGAAGTNVYRAVPTSNCGKCSRNLAR